MTEDQMRELFREMREEPVPADSLARVRLGVDQRLRKRSWWKLAVPLIAAGCILAAFLLLRPARTLIQVQAPSLPEIAHVEPPTDVPIPAAPRPKRVRAKHAGAVPVSIRIETPDPDVVILLVN
jgi:hypothetical protein